MLTLEIKGRASSIKEWKWKRRVPEENLREVYQNNNEGKRILGTQINIVCLIAHLCPTLCDSLDCNPSDSVHRILQARVLEWVAISSSRGSFQPRDQTRISCVSCPGMRADSLPLYPWATWEALSSGKPSEKALHLFLPHFTPPTGKRWEQ